MSRYFDALNRLRRTREAAPGPDLHLAEPSEPVAGTATGETPGSPGLPFPELQLASRQASYASLLDLLRATSKTASIPAVVIAGVSGGGPVHEVVAGIDLQAQRQGIAVRLGTLTLSTGSRALHLLSRRPLRDAESPGSTKARESLRLSGPQQPSALGDWLESAAADSDLLLIEAPPISSSVEAALVGSACAGLVLVAEALVTKRAALQDAVKRVRLANSEILGIVLTGTKPWLPSWLGRMIALVDRS